MNFWIKNFRLKRTLFNKRYVSFDYFNGYAWKHLKVQFNLSYDISMSYYTNLMLNAIHEDLNKRKQGLEDYRKIVPFFEQLNRLELSNATKLGR